MSRQHVFLPQTRRKAAAGHPGHGRIVIIAEPHACHQIGAVADKPSVTEILARACLAGDGATDIRRTAGSLFDHPGQHLVEAGDITQSDDAPGAGTHALVKNFSLRGAYFLDTMGPDAIAFIGKRRIGSRHLDQRSLAGAQCQSRAARQMGRQTKTARRFMNLVAARLFAELTERMRAWDSVIGPSNLPL